MSIKINSIFYRINKDSSFSTENFGIEAIEDNEIKIPTSESINQFLEISSIQKNEVLNDLTNQKKTFKLIDKSNQDLTNVEMLNEAKLLESLSKEHIAKSLQTGSEQIRSLRKDAIEALKDSVEKNKIRREINKDLAKSLDKLFGDQE
jgi:hypothetical protein